jgi:NRPS condensation-like uncharacterized protein
MSKFEACSLSHQQREIWYLVRKGYLRNIQDIVRYEGRIDWERFYASVMKALEGTTTYRIGIRPVRGHEEPEGILLPRHRVAFECCELQGVAHAEKTAQQELDSSFDLEAGPLLRISVYRIPRANTNVIAFTASPVCTDLWGINLLASMIMLEYRKATYNRPRNRFPEEQGNLSAPGGIVEEKICHNDSHTHAAIPRLAGSDRHNPVAGPHVPLAHASISSLLKDLPSARQFLASHAAQPAEPPAPADLLFKTLPMTENKNHYELTPAQLRLWRLSRDRKASVAHNLSVAYMVDGIIDRDVFNKAMQHLIARHEILRTNFEEINGSPKQVIRSADRASFRLQQYEGYDEFDPTRIIDLLVARRFDLESDLLVRASVVKLEPQKQLLVFSTHSIIMDEWSLRLMVNELARNYNMYLRHGAIHSQPLVFQFKDYSAWMNGRMEKNKAAGEYWSRCLHNFTPGSFPKDMEEDKPSFRGEMLVFEPAEDNSAALKQLAVEQNCNLFDVLAAMLSVLVCKYTGRHDICLGTIASGRQIPGLAEQLGMFANNIVLRNHLDQNESFAGLLKEVQESVSEAFEHQSYPLEWVVENDDSLFDVMITYRSPEATFTRQSRIQGMELLPFEIPHRNSRFPLTFSFFEEQDDVFCNVEYNSEMFRIETIQIIMEKFQKLSAAIIQDPTKPIGSYSVELEIEKELKQAITIELDF